MLSILLKHPLVLVHDMFMYFYIDSILCFCPFCLNTLWCTLHAFPCASVICHYVMYLDGTLKSRDITLPAKVRLVKAMVFPVVTDMRVGW